MGIAARSLCVCLNPPALNSPSLHTASVQRRSPRPSPPLLDLSKSLRARPSYHTGRRKMCYPENFLAAKANEIVCGQLDVYSSASSPKEKYLAGEAGRVDGCNYERRTLSKQTSLRETKMEAKWEKRRRQILERERRVGAEAEKKAAAKGSENRGITGPKILTDEDMDELRGSIELGFGFVEEEGGNDLRDTLPALNLYFAVNRQLSDKKLIPPTSSEPTPSATTSPSGTPSPRGPNARTRTEAAAVASYAWQICSPGDNPQCVKTRLRHWAQAVACSMRQSC